MTHVERDGLRLYVDDRGSGEPVLLLHGHTFDHRIWEQASPGLMDAGRRVIAPDLRGHGRSTRPDSGYTPAHHAADMLWVLDELGVGSATVVGYSIGGGIALEMAIARPAACAALVLVEPVLPDRPFEPEFFASLKEVAGVVRERGVRDAMLGPWTDCSLFAPSFRRPGVRERFQEIVRDFPGADYLAVRRDTVEREWTVPERLGELEMPTTVVSAEHTLPGFRSWADEIVAAVPRARHEVVPDTGHLLLFEEPEVLTRLILRARPVS